MSEKEIGVTQVMSSKRVLVVELEMALWPGVQRTFDVLSAVLKKRNVSLDKAGFVRFFLSKKFRTGYTDIMISSGKNGDVDAMMEETQEALGASLSNKDGMYGLGKVLDAAREKGMELCVITQSDVEMTTDMVTAAGGTPEETVEIEGNTDLVCVNPVEIWKRALRETVAYPRLSLGIVCSSGSVKGALASGIRVAAITSELTAGGDFSGADVVVDDLSDDSIDALIELIGRD